MSADTPQAELIEKPCKIIADGRKATYEVIKFAHKLSLQERSALSIQLAATRGAFAQQQASIALTYACASCDSCKPLRVDVAKFEPSKSQKDVLARNDDLTLAVGPPHISSEHTILFQAYLENRHPNSNSVASDAEHLRQEALSNNKLFNLRDNNGNLLAFSLIKQNEEGIISEYTIYNAGVSAKRSLGTLMQLKTLEYAKEQKIPYIYTGALNLESKELKRKAAFNSCEVFDRNSGEWLTIPREPTPQDLQFTPDK